MADQDLVARVQALRATIEAGRDRRVRATAAKEQAEQSLAALLQEHGCTTIDELVLKANEARAAAETMLTSAEQALAQ